jgi:hypothetical protein
MRPGRGSRGGRRERIAEAARFPARAAAARLADPAHGMRGAETWLVALAFGGLGATTAGWNGVPAVAGSLRLAPPGAASGAALSVAFGGAVPGPPAMAVLGRLMGGYAIAFAWLALLPPGGAAVARIAGRGGAVAGRPAPRP